MSHKWLVMVLCVLVGMLLAVPVVGAASKITATGMDVVDLSAHGKPNLLLIYLSDGSRAEVLDCCNGACAAQATAVPTTALTVVPTSTAVPTTAPSITPDPTDPPATVGPAPTAKPKRNCGVGNGTDPDTRGCADGRNDGPGTGPGDPGSKGGNGNGKNK